MYYLFKSGGLMSAVVFKENCSDAVRWFWKGRPEQYDSREVERGVKALRYELY